MATLEVALQIAARAHVGQTDRGGHPYILHPLNVLYRVSDPDARIVAVLHDVVEDTSVTLDDLREAGFAPAILEAVRLVTHLKHEPYADYVVRCKGNPLAAAVKRADLEENTRLDRAILRPARTGHDLARLRKYILSYRFLTDQIGELEYRREMARESGEWGEGRG